MPDGPEGPLDAQDLYRLPPEEFTAARDALARRLRADGNRARAEEVRRLRRPNIPAWALDQVAQTEPGLIERVLAVGGELREAMETGDGRRLREAERSTRQASEAVVDRAERVLAAAGASSTDDVRARMSATLRAAILDPEVASRLQSGTLERDVELPGLGTEMALAPATRPPVSRPKPTEEDRQQQEREREERRRREQAVRAARARVAELESEARRLGRNAQRLAALAERAEEEARRAREDATAAEAEADDAAARAVTARRELEEQEEALG